MPEQVPYTYLFTVSSAQCTVITMPVGLNTYLTVHRCDSPETGRWARGQIIPPTDSFLVLPPITTKNIFTNSRANYVRES